MLYRKILETILGFETFTIKMDFISYLRIKFLLLMYVKIKNYS